MVRLGAHRTTISEFDHECASPVIAEVTARIASAAATARGLSRRMDARKAPARARNVCPAPISRTASPRASLDDKAALRAPTGAQSRHRHRLQRHAVGASAVRALPGTDRRRRARRATAQVAGGVPAMCDGVTQGQPGMELSLFSRDVIAMSTAIALSHDMFDGALCLGVCDKIVPGPAHRRAGLRPPAGGLRAGRPDDLGHAQQGEGAKSASSTPRARSAARRCSKSEAAVLSRARHLHLLRHRQLQPDADGDDGPAPAGRAFVNPEHAAARCADRRGATARGRDHRARATNTCRSAQVIDERAIVNGVVGLHRDRRLDQPHAASRRHGARGGHASTGTISTTVGVVPLLARIYPNGSADVNHFHAAGGMGFLIARAARRRACCTRTSRPSPARGLGAYAQEPWLCDDGDWSGATAPPRARDRRAARRVDDPFQRRRRPAAAARQSRPRGDQDLRGQAASTA